MLKPLVILFINFRSITSSETVMSSKNFFYGNSSFSVFEYVLFLVVMEAGQEWVFLRFTDDFWHVDGFSARCKL